MEWRQELEEVVKQLKKTNARNLALKEEKIGYEDILAGIKPDNGNNDRPQ